VETVVVELLLNKEITDEFERLRSLFLSADEVKTKLVENLIQQAAFMKVELEVLQVQIRKYGTVQVSTKGMQRQTESAKYYTKLINAYGTVIKTLNSILGKNVQEGDDAFDEFLKRASGQ
jgi:regulator of replication initiation timing